MADLQCPNCGSKFSFSEQLKSTDHWFKNGSCPKCKEGILEPQQSHISLSQMVVMSVALIATLALGLVLHTLGMAEWTSSSVLLYGVVFTLAFYIPLYFVSRSLFSGTTE